MPKSWTWFSKTIRNVVKGSALVTEILDAILDNNQTTIDEILTECSEYEDKLTKLVDCAHRTSKTFYGRIAVKALAEKYRTEASWPTDDISLRRAYEIYKSGRLATCLPQVDELVTRLA